MGIMVVHASAYNNLSMGLVEREMAIWKNILKKSPPHLTQLQISDLMCAHESTDTEHGSNLA